MFTSKCTYSYYLYLFTGQKFFQHEDYESALEIYNFGIEQVCPNYASVWNNRAAVYLKIGNFHQAIKDATRALELLDPPVDSNALMRAKALIRRGLLIYRGPENLKKSRQKNS